ncbi:MAG: DUF350 domain-containing protein [Propionibacteriaceae bacterium]
MLLDYLATVPHALVVLGACLVFLTLQWHLVSWLTTHDDSADLRRGNLAESIERGSLVLAHVIGLACAITLIDSENFWPTCGVFALAALAITVLPLATRPFLNHVLLPTIDDDAAIAEGNVALALVRGGAFLGIGCIAGASLMGTTGAWWSDIAAALLFFALGLFLVTIVYWLHEQLTPYDLHGRISAGKVGAGVESGSLILAISMVTAIGVAGDMTSWANGLLAFGLTAVIALALLIPAWYLLTAFGPGHLPHALHNDDNDAGAIVVAGFLVGIALLVCVLLRIL